MGSNKLQVGVNDLETYCKKNNRLDLLNEWDYEGNGELLPNMVSWGSHIKTAWKCKEGHKWVASTNSRVRGSNCPYCSNQRTLKGYNDFVTLCKQNNKEILIQEYNTDKNADINLDELNYGAIKKVWWKCSKCGYEWVTSVRNRTIYNTGCNECANNNAGNKIRKFAIQSKGSLKENYPELAKEWDYTKNTLTPDEVMGNSNIKIWWLCPSFKHSYCATPSKRNRLGNETGCPYCSGKKVLIGFNDLVTTNPSLVKEWNYDKNQTKPEQYTAGSGKSVWWKCEKGHEWQIPIVNRTNGSGCPYCSNKKILSGYNDLATLNPTMAEEWSERNGSLLPNQVSANYNKKVWWKCKECGNEWQTTVNARTSNNSGCPYCSGRKVIEGKTDLLTLYPDLVYKEWDFEKNTVLPNKITAHNMLKVWWNCPEGHSYQQKVSDKTKGNGCPICSGYKVVQGINDLETVFPKLAKEWNYSKNTLTPNFYYARSKERVWWKCEYGHEWKIPIANRANGSGCPKCAKELQTSFPEQSIYYYIKQLFPDTINGDRRFKKELDIYIPSKKIAIEYDGRVWHNDKKKNKDTDKNELCQKEGIKLYRIREIGCPFMEETSQMKIFEYKYTDWDSLSKIISSICSDISEQTLDVNIERDKDEILKQYISDKKDRSLATKFPELIKDWNYNKNGVLTPENIYASSPKNVWWKCSKCGYEWRSSPNNRTTNNKVSMCPSCAKKYVGKCNARQVLNIDTNEIYESVSDAYRKTGINNISMCCNGKLQTAGGYHWKYLEGSKIKQIKCVETGVIYNHSADAERQTGINRKYIKKACENSLLTAGDYHWTYVD